MNVRLSSKPRCRPARQIRWQIATAGIGSALGATLVSGISRIVLAAALMAGLLAIILVAPLAHGNEGQRPVGLRAVGGWAIVGSFAVATFLAEAAIAGAIATRDGTINLSVEKLAPLVIMLGAAFVASAHASPEQVQMRSTHLGAPLYWLFGYLAWMFVSAVLATDKHIGILRVIQAVIPVIALLAYRRTNLARRYLLYAVSAACAVHVGIGVFNHGNAFAYTGRVNGILVTNTFTFASAVVFAAAFGLLQTGLERGKIALCALFVVLGAWGVVVSKGRGGVLSILGVVVGTALLTTRSNDLGEQKGRAAKRRQLLARGAVIVSPLLLALKWSSLVDWIVRGDTAGLMTLSNRTTIWRLGWEAALHRPVFGYGPGALRSGSLSSINDAFSRNLGSAHNSYVEALVSAGFLGALLLIGMMVALGRQAYAGRSKYRPLVVSVFIMLLINSFSIAMMSGFGMGWYVLIALLAAVEPEPATGSDTSPPAANEHLVGR